MTDQRVPNTSETPEERIEALISDHGLGLFSGDVQDEVETILASGQSLEPSVRAGLIEAAKRGVRHVEITQAPLEVVLFNERRDRGQDAEDVASRAGIDSTAIRSIERGERAIDDETPANVAAWALSVGIDRTLVDAALRKSLGVPASAAAYAGDRESRLTAEQETFVDLVLKAFDRWGEGTPTE